MVNKYKQDLRQEILRLIAFGKKINYVNLIKQLDYHLGYGKLSVDRVLDSFEGVNKIVIFDGIIYCSTEEIKTIKKLLAIPEKKLLIENKKKAVKGVNVER